MKMYIQSPLSLCQDQPLLSDFREGTFFLGGRGGGELGNFGIFSKRKVLALPCILIKRTLDPPLLGD